MKDIKKALESIKQGFMILTNYCDSGASCGECILNGALCNGMDFEKTITIIEEWQSKHGAEAPNE
jgi:hypothetical protein